MTNTVFAPISTQTIFHSGVVAVGAKAYFYDAGSTTPRSIWTKSDGTVAASNPVIADGDGVIPPTWITGTADYRIVIKTSTDVLIRTIEGLKGADSETTAVVGGDSYALVTGDIKWNFDSSEISGFVRLNGTTIGNASSFAHYADDLLVSLFTYLWNKLANAQAPVSGGRGANAAADFTAGKTLTLPDMTFRSLIGLSNMGNGLSGLAANWPSSNAPGVAVGGSTLTLSSGNLPSHTHTGTTASGSGTIAGNTSTDGAHVHTGATTDNPGDHTHSYIEPSLNTTLTGATAVSLYTSSFAGTTGAAGGHTHAVTVPNTSSTHTHALTADPSTHTHTFTTAATGSGTAADIINPCLTATCYMKT